mmetsp:Transcript_2624/g.10472  ORF Transcript_2624/g.10472 Transcript_2624/m.10472 type:complete len:200 (+) Transcript_2624:70-669(+)
MALRARACMRGEGASRGTLARSLAASIVAILPECLALGLEHELLFRWQGGRARLVQPYAAKLGHVARTAVREGVHVVGHALEVRNGVPARSFVRGLVGNDEVGLVREHGEDKEGHDAKSDDDGQRQEVAREPVADLNAVHERGRCLVGCPARTQALREQEPHEEAVVGLGSSIKGNKHAVGARASVGTSHLDGWWQSAM